ncbi:endochitinase-like [Quercus suber]|uniref:endochitinase-like n=1 Tax=Quercus suber TaxID=58331 RepID=UPI0032DF1A4A
MTFVTLSIKDVDPNFDGSSTFVSNYNYGQAATDPIISFKTAIWFWMTPQANKPSSHDVIIGNWRPFAADASAGQVPGYGVITKIINGGLECGHGSDNRVADRIGFYKRYCDILGVS